MKVNWVETLKEWKPSAGQVVQITAPATIECVAKVLEYFYMLGEESRITLMNAQKSKLAMLTDTVGTWDLLETGATQLREHQHIWETHIEEKATTGNFVVEFPICIKDVKQVRYFKISMVGGAKGITVPSTLSKIAINYHSASQQIEVIYE